MNNPADWCRFCGQRHNDGHPWCRCVASVGTVDEVASMIESARSGAWMARSSLANISVPDARPLLEALVDDPDSSVAGGAASSLAALASPESWDVMLRLREEGRYHLSVVRYLGRLGNDRARAALNDLLDDDNDETSLAAAISLGVLGDHSVVDRLVDAVRTNGAGGPIAWYLAEPRFSVRSHPLSVLAVLADPSAVEPLADLLYVASDLGAAEDAWLEQHRLRMDETRIIATEKGWPYQEASGDAHEELLRHQAAKVCNEVIDNLTETVRRIGGAVAATAIADACERLGRQVPRWNSRQDAPEADDSLELVVTPTRPAWALRPFAQTTADHADPGTRFRGQPAWRTEPTWPLTKSGTPMSFWAQFELPWDPTRTAYLFLDVNDGEMGWSDDGSACLFIQPSPFRPDAHERRATGPVVPDDTFGHSLNGFADDGGIRFDAGIAALTPFDDALVLDDTTDTTTPFDKLGGTPLWLQGDESPGDRFRFLFEFSAGGVGWELADGADCYGFVDELTGEGWFLWQCH